MDKHITVKCKVCGTVITTCRCFSPFKEIHWGVCECCKGKPVIAIKAPQTDRQLKWDARFLRLAKHIASWSKDPSTKVGAVIVRNANDIVSLGYNGFPQAMLDFPDQYENREEKYSRVVHAEINALIFAKQRVQDCTLYTFPFMPCDRCIVQVIQAGIKRVVTLFITDPAQLERWGNSFTRTRDYCRESSVSLVELDDDLMAAVE